MAGPLVALEAALEGVGAARRHHLVTLSIRSTCYAAAMAPELPESEIRRVVRHQMRERALPTIGSTIPPGRRASGGTRCVVCGFDITAGRNECEVGGLWANETCAVIWRQESDRLS